MDRRSDVANAQSLESRARPLSVSPGKSTKLADVLTVLLLSGSKEAEGVTSLLDFEHVHEDPEHDDRDARPDVDAEALTRRVLEFRDRVRERIRCEGENAVC